MVQLVAGFRKMGTYDNLEVVVGSIHDEEAYRQIDEYIRVVTVFKQLRTMTVGVVGHVFRGMFDFEYDKTMVKGGLGPEVVNIQIHHLLDLWQKAGENDPAVQALVQKVHANYTIDGVADNDIVAAARMAVAMKRLVERFRLDGLVLLGQHLRRGADEDDVQPGHGRAARRRPGAGRHRRRRDRPGDDEDSPQFYRVGRRSSANGRSSTCRRTS